MNLHASRKSLNLETPVASGSLEFAVLVTGFVVQTLSCELLEPGSKKSLLINANSTNSQNMLALESGVNSDAHSSLAKQWRSLMVNSRKTIMMENNGA